MRTDRDMTMIEGKKSRVSSEKEFRTKYGVSIIGLILLVILFAAISIFAGKRRAWANYSPRGEQKGLKITQTMEKDSSSGLSQDAGKGRVLTDKDIEKAYKELLKKKKEELESVKTLKADKGSFYQVKLVSGRSLLAVEIQAKGDTVIITDDNGLVIRLGKQEIADIKKVEE